jgi:choline dehydrogenase-like flavoprotein
MLEPTTTPDYLSAVVTDPAETLRYDIAIIGSGMGGGTLAYALRHTGARILIIEQGDFLPREWQNWSPRAVQIENRYKNSAYWYQPDGSKFLPGNYHYVGGSTKFYGATMPRFREHDFGEVEHVDGVSPAWPIDYTELEPHYAEFERIYRVHGNKGDDPTDPWRSTDFPYPFMGHEPVIEHFAEAVRAQGLHPFGLPQAVDLRENGNCVRCSTCDAFPCLVDGKGDADVSAVRPALRSGNVQILTDATVDYLETDASGKRVVAAHARHRGGKVRIEAGRFVSAAGAVNSAALLLRSASQAHPDGLANSSGQLGRNYMCHVTTFFLAADPRRRNDVVFQKTIGINDWYSAGPDNPYPLGNVQGLGKVKGATVRNARKWVPLPVLDAVTNHTVDLFLQSEDLPLPENRVTLGAGDKVVLDYRRTNLTAHRDLIRRMKHVVRQAGYPVVLHQELGVEASSHQCGTARMGTDPATSVVTPGLRTHDVDNLWIVDSSPFVSSAAVNPAPTIAALALRTAAAGELTA